MNSRTWRSITLALVVASFLSMGAAAPAEARSLDLPGRAKVEFVRFADRAASSISSMLQGLNNWIASSAAAICGDGSN